MAIFDDMSDHNPVSAQRLKDDVEAKVAALPSHPLLYRIGRVVGTREMVVRSNYLVVYTHEAERITILRVLHAAQAWPPAAP